MTSDPSTIVTDPRPLTSRMSLASMIAAVSSSSPRPINEGDWATTASSRPRRVRCSKCWSTTTLTSKPRPTETCAMRCLGVAPELPKAIMWVATALAPADVPATTTPRPWASRTAAPSLVPPASWTKRERMTRSPSLSSAPPMTITGPTGPPSVVGASRSGVDASVIHVSVPAFQLPRHAAFLRNLICSLSHCRVAQNSHLEGSPVLHSTERIGCVAQRPRDLRRARQSPSRPRDYRQYEYPTVLESYCRYISIRRKDL